MLCVTKAYALPDVDVIILDFFFKSATLELIEVLPAKEKSILAGAEFDTPLILSSLEQRSVIADLCSSDDPIHIPINSSLAQADA